MLIGDDAKSEQAKVASFYQTRDPRSFHSAANAPYRDGVTNHVPFIDEIPTMPNPSTPDTPPQNSRAAIIVIGDEILSGRTKDKNIGWLAEELNGMGIMLVEARVIPDIKQVIIDTVLEMSRKCDLVFTSGGIGPTHDDITTDAIAAAFGKAVIRHPEAEAVLRKHYANTDIEFNAARQKMADIPQDAALIDNPASAAPGFVLENVYVLPGVPSILQAMFGGLKPQLPGGLPMTRITVQCATGEGNIATILESVQTRHKGISVGSYPWFKPGQFGTAVVVSGLDAAVTAQAAEKVAAEVTRMGADAYVVQPGDTA